MGAIKVDKRDSVKMYRIRKLLEDLSRKRGRGTELISVYIPKNRQLHEVISVLQSEQGTASNIKSDLTRTHVVDALAKVIQRLKLYKKTPERGLVVFCGALPPEEGGPIGSEVLETYEIDPIKDLKQYLYRCDDHFHLDILRGMLRDDNAIGFLAIDAKDCGWGLLLGDRLEVLSQTGSGVAGKHRQGGQSAKRFQKLREMELTYYFNRVGKTTQELFLDIHKVKGIIVSGPGPTKDDFLKGNYLEYRLQNMVLATIDSSYSGAEGVREAFAKSSDILSDFRLVEEKKLVERLFMDINRRSGLAAYGMNEVLGHIANNVAQTVLISDDIDMHRVVSTCRRCGKERLAMVERSKVIPTKSEFASTPCPSCQSEDMQITEQDIIEHISLICSKIGAAVEIISGKSEHGAMLSSLGSVASTLRYNPGHS
ncbi:MAG: peptide chain release factor 1 [Cenarchaeum sp. SB0665_bin_23]|nr:peptide chain release factor 1 [Cenarchaeum sp. SB0667_bin_13]MXY37323.1 peptide chain release factor 1 [Cenarchaeum sp. SB0664_bin_35]MXY61686.1 peptide chain release factor 1 [Cenarchaeum sp. SB0665_bin_23]MXZ92884.1 peptide chain release factor 1 [Cenarchaeum sp. SB0666_bin_15]MYB46432.1 peptide chain release factor 1 [Cenarchaeum sp. SB0662_bin_33]MYC79211.1 peptide chain release factor 1 [Cenarchaeum sp. SB0661_bin_35]MYD58081.1 peptide chain release factor 1 [Cenarchaeum sp. SB0678_b